MSAPCDIDYMTRREQVCEAIARHRKRLKCGFLRRPIVVTKAQLDQLEERVTLTLATARQLPYQIEALNRCTIDENGQRVKV